MPFLPKTPPQVRWIIAGAVALAGAATMILILVFMDALEDEGLTMVASAALGAGLSGALFAGFFGMIRKAGDWFLFAVGAVLSTALGSFLGGVVWGILMLILEEFPQDEFLLLLLARAGALGFMVVMIVMPAEHTVSVAIWAAIMLAAQALSVWARAYRTAA